MLQKISPGQHLSYSVISIEGELITEPMGKPQIAIRMPPSLMAKFNSYVEKIGTSKTEVVVSAIALRALPGNRSISGLSRRCAIESENG